MPSFRLIIINKNKVFFKTIYSPLILLVCLRCYGSFTPDNCCMYTCLSPVLWQLYTWRMSYVYLSLVCVRYHGSFTPDDYCMYIVCVRCYGSFTPDDYCMYTCLCQVLWQLYIWRLLCVYLFVSDVMAAFYLTTVACILVCLRCYGSFTPDECRMCICHLFVSGTMVALHLTTIVCILFVSGVMVALHLTTIVCILVCVRCYGSFTSDDYCVYTCLSQMLWQLSTWRILYVSKS